MLARLSIRNVILIKSLDLDLAAGFCVLTGETGAGKSILLDALGLALGRRADAGLLRAGAERASVSAVFQASPAARVWLAERDLDVGDELVLRRSLGADGRSRAFVNDAPVTVAALAELGGLLVQVYGQHDKLGLMDTVTHREALDAFGGLGEARRAVAKAHARWRETDAVLCDAEAAAEADRVDREALEGALAMLDELAPEIGEEVHLAAERSRMMAAESIAAALDEAAKAFAGDGRPVEETLTIAQRAVERVRVSAAGALDAAAGALDKALIEIGEAGLQLDAAATALDADPGRLEQVEERLFALRAAARRYDCAVDTLPETRERLAAQLVAFDVSEAGLATLRQTAEVAHADFVTAVQALSDGRKMAVKRLDRAVSGELGALHLSKVSFVTTLEQLDDSRWGPTGAERVRFRIATNRGQPVAPLSDIASGGELSRFMLALCVALSASMGTSSLVFDEIDSGVGGAVADAIGKRLARLAETSQVLVVTHLPQVAARADCHFRVAKQNGKGSTVTGIKALAADEHREEIARMLAGAEVTESARAAADSLIGGGGA